MQPYICPLVIVPVLIVTVFNVEGLIKPGKSLRPNLVAVNRPAYTTDAPSVPVTICRRSMKPVYITPETRYRRLSLQPKRTLPKLATANREFRCDRR